MTSGGLAEIREPDAAPATAAIYAEIRAATGLPFVNLLWRHMAALPGVLPWIWGIVGDQYRAGNVGRAALALRDEVPDLGLAPLRSADLSAAGLDGAAQRILRNLVAAYNRGNTQNLIGWSALRRHLRGDDDNSEAGALERRSPLPAPLSAMPTLPAAGQLAPATLAAVDRLAGRHASFPPGARPSLYLHLAIWPNLLGPVDARLAPLFDGGRLKAAVTRVSTVADQEALLLAPHLTRTTDAPPDDVRAQIMPTLETFVSQAVQEMIVIGVALERALARS